MKTVALIAYRLISVGLIVLVLMVLGFVGIVEIRLVNNNPFDDVAEVVRIDEDKVEFADGRILKLDAPLENEQRALIESSNRLVGLERTCPECTLIRLCVRRPHTNCQLGRPSIVLPIIMVDRPRYARQSVVFGVMPTPPLSKMN